MPRTNMIKLQLATHIKEIFRKFDFESLNIDDYLDQRDLEPFNNNWLTAFHNIERLKQILDEKKQKEIKKISDVVRKKIFFEVIQHSDSSSLAGYISDDFGLISDALSLEIEISWIYGLLKCYLDGILPMGSITPIKNPINH